MKTINVELKGDALLMHSPKAMLEPQKKTREKMKVYDPEIEAEKGAYRTSKGELYVPAEALKASILRATLFRKAEGKKISLKPLVAAGVLIQPLQIILNKQKYEIDLRTVVIQRQRIVRARPLINDWAIKFNIIYDENLISSDVIQTCLEDAGLRIGLLDFRPEKGGSFGTFKITKFEVEEDAKRK